MTWTPPAAVAALARQWREDGHSLQRELGEELAAVGGNIPVLCRLARSFAAEAADCGRELARNLDGEDTWDDDMFDIWVIYARSAAELSEALGGITPGGTCGAAAASPPS